MHARRTHDIALPCAKLQAVTRLSQNRNIQKIIYMMHDGWHSHYLPYLSSGQQAVTGSLAVSLGSRALQSPSRQRFADFTCVLHDGKMGGFPFCCPLHHCISLVYARVKLLSLATSTLKNVGERVGFAMPGLLPQKFLFFVPNQIARRTTL